MADNYDLMEVNDLAKNSNGGTEIMLRRLYRDLPRELLEQFQIVPTRLSQELRDDKIRLYYCHDLPGDPSCDEALKDGKWQRFPQPDDWK